MAEKSIVDFLKEHAAKKPVAFHMPGHKGASFFREFGYSSFLDIMADADITEIAGADNLFQAEDIILTTMRKYERLYGVKKSYLLVNGTSGGILAAVMAAVPKGKKLIMARNCHKSVFNALSLAGIEPVYAYPEFISEYGISGAVSADEIARLLAENPDAEAVIFPSPNYYGICSDIEAIADVVHRADKILIVDQAHGAHLKFFSKFGSLSGADMTGALSEESVMRCADKALLSEDAACSSCCVDAAGNLCSCAVRFPKSAEEQGADIAINSVHKTLGSFTQSAVMNVNSDKIDLNLLEDKLQMVESSSPSYLLLASLDMSADIIDKHGPLIFARWKENIEWFLSEAKKIKGLSVMNSARQGASGEFDSTKLNLDMSALGLSGDMLDEELMKRGIYSELVTGNILMCMTGMGNVRGDYEKLLAALCEIAERYSGGRCREAGVCRAKNDLEMHKNEMGEVENGGVSLGYPCFGTLELCSVPDDKEKVRLCESADRVCAVSIIPYPPGIPLVCPGEKITAELAAYVSELRARGHKVIGVTADGKVTVGKENNR